VDCSGVDDAVSAGLSGGPRCDTSVRGAIGGGVLNEVSFARFGFCVVSGGGCDCPSMAVIAALRSIGHIDARTWKGTWTSNIRHISIIC